MRSAVLAGALEALRFTMLLAESQMAPCWTYSALPCPLFHTLCSGLLWGRSEPFGIPPSVDFERERESWRELPAFLRVAAKFFLASFKEV